MLKITKKNLVLLKYLILHLHFLPDYHLNF